MERFRASFAGLADPRRGNARRHDLLEILLVALLATLSGAETCVDMASFGRAKEVLLRQFLRLPGGIPSHDTFQHLFRILDPEALEACFAGFVASLAARVAGVVAIDGCTVTADAMHCLKARCQKATAEAILAHGDDYALAVRGR